MVPAEGRAAMTDAHATFHPTTCPMRADRACRNAEAQCLGCTWPEEALAPTAYLPVDRAHDHPVIAAEKAARRVARQAAKRTEASRRGRASRQKGARTERAFAKLAGGERVPLSGALRGSLTNDVALPDGLRVEVKARRDGWRELYRWVLDEAERPDAVVLKADHRPWLVVQRYDVWAAGRQPAPVDLAKLAEARRLLEEAME